MNRDGPCWNKDKYNPLRWERDLMIAIVVRAVKDCFCLDSSEPEAYAAYNFLMDDKPWDMINVSQECRTDIRRIVPDPATIPTTDGVIHLTMEIFRDP